MNVAIFALAAVRGGEAPRREPVNQVQLSPTSASVVLTLDLATVDFPSYRASLQGADGKEVWQARGLHPDSRDALVLLLPASMLPPDVYQLRLDGAKRDGTFFPVGVYPFRVLRRP